ncbi:MAG: exodeoxyribonuclease VII large subunit [Bacteroidetes bacterium]|nr:exodeoxyribonuclease VII large subunit [Bacteroidota bacterium]
MPENIGDKKVFSLIEVASSIKATLANRYGSPFWLKAEMNKLNFYAHSGHCYPDLLQKSDGKVLAQMKAIIWKSDYERIAAMFLSQTGEALRDGMNVVVLADIGFDANHGLNLHISDIDPDFTLGQLEGEKRRCIEKLSQEGIINNNKQLPFPVLPKRLAIISVESSKGYADFIKLTESRMRGFTMQHMLFPALLQGDKAVGQILRQLARIRTVAHHFDLVAIIRGGGGDVGLSCYNDYTLASAIARFPLPVITGIGHATNETVCEMVANTNAITPSELADLLLERFEGFSEKLQFAATQIARSRWFIRDSRQELKLQQHLLFAATRKLISDSRNIQHACSHTLSGDAKLQLVHAQHAASNSLFQLKLSSHQLLDANKQQFKNFRQGLNNACLGLVDVNKHLLRQHERTLDLLNPENLLRKGYSMTLLHGKLVTNASELAIGDTITTRLADGSIDSNILNINE